MKHQNNINDLIDFGRTEFIRWLEERAGPDQNVMYDRWTSDGAWNKNVVGVQEHLATINGSPRLFQVHEEVRYWYGNTYVVVLHKSNNAVHIAYLEDDESWDTARRVFVPTEEHEMAQWFYTNNKGVESVAMKLVGDNPHQAFYPNIDSLMKFYDDFSASKASVLILLGPPGTGKTTFVRGFLRHAKMQAWLTYDEKTQADEALYIRFSSSGTTYDDNDNTIEGNVGRILVLEDADALLESRRDGNKLMARLLNLSNGLVDFPKRKLVFSTNLPSLQSVDQALLRPGRCFAIVKFGTLTNKQANDARRAVGLQETSFPKPVTLAEALNDQYVAEEVVTKVGF